jgi:hypothetical protein
MNGETQVDVIDHVWRVDQSDHDQALKFDVDGKTVIVFAYQQPHSPQVFVYDDPAVAERHWRLARHTFGHPAVEPAAGGDTDDGEVGG